MPVISHRWSPCSTHSGDWSVSDQPTTTWRPVTMVSSSHAQPLPIPNAPWHSYVKVAAWAYDSPRSLGPRSYARGYMVQPPSATTDRASSVRSFIHDLQWWLIG